MYSESSGVLGQSQALWCWWYAAHMWQKVQVPGYEREPLFHVMHIAWTDSGYRFSCTPGLGPIGAPMAIVDMEGGAVHI